MSLDALRNAATVLALAALLAGCDSSDRAGVYGVVTRADGAPLAGARVTAKSKDGKFVRGITDVEGKYQLGVAEYGDGVPPGEYQVTVHEDRGDSDDRTPRTLPEKYENPDESGLTLNVTAGGATEFNIKLEAL
jgi:hypothetical protein